jgi:hypothetical protein
MSDHLNYKVNKNSNLHQGFFMPKNRDKYKGVRLPFFRSMWERIFMEFLDGNKNVLEWISEKPEVPYINPHTGTKWNYHPDFVVKVKDGNTTRIEMIELKPKHEAGPPVPSPKKRKKTLLEQQERWILNSAKWEAARAYCKAHKWNFKVLYMEDKIFKEIVQAGYKVT